jgi:hypothetical protein
VHNDDSWIPEEFKEAMNAAREGYELILAPKPG